MNPLSALIALPLALALSTAQGAELRLQVDRTRLGIDDILGVQLMAEGEIQGEPDLAPRAPAATA